MYGSRILFSHRVSIFRCKRHRARLGDYLKPMANNWLVVGDKFVLGFAGKRDAACKSLTDAGLSVQKSPRLAANVRKMRDRQAARRR